jgi:CRP/FNR family transcriptional regulator
MNLEALAALDARNATRSCVGAQAAEPEPGGCALCGFARVCFPARAVHDAARPPVDLRIRRTRVPRGRAIYRCGEKVDAFFMIRSGCVKELDESSGRGAAVLHFALPGEILSLHNVGSPVCTTTSIAVEPSHLCIVPWAAFRQLCAETPAVESEFLRLIAQAGVAARELLLLIRDKDALARVAGFLQSLRRRLQLHGLGGREVRLGMTREEIADYLGLRSETVSRCFTELARRGLIQVRAKRVRFLDDAAHPPQDHSNEE